MEWAASEHVVAPAKEGTDQSLASAEKTAKKSKWVFGDDELTEDDEDKKLGEDNLDGEEAWQRSAKKQHKTFERFRKAPQFDMTVDPGHIQNAITSAQRKQSNPHTFRKHGIASREQQVQSDEESEQVHSEKESILKYTPDLAKLRLNREKLRNGEYDEEDYRPLFRRADCRLVRKLHPVPTSLDDSVAPSTLVDLFHHDRVGAWV